MKKNSNRRRNPKGKVLDEKFDKNKSFDKRESNDPYWYGHNEMLLKDAASIPFSWALGTATDLIGHGFEIATEYGDKMEYRLYDKDHVWPGILNIQLCPTFGWSEDPSSPINVAAMQLYSYVRHANSGHANYDATDLMMYCVGMGSVYSYINWVQRIYGLAMMYNQRNRYMPKGVIEANNVDFDDVLHNLANLRYGLNVIINKAAAMAVPATLSYFSREAFLYKNLYIESGDLKSQLYQYIPTGFFEFSLDDQGAGKLSLVTVAASVGVSKLSVSDILAVGNRLLVPYLEDEDLGIMSGDILKAYGDNILKLMPLTEDYIVPAVYDPVVLYQIKNATMCIVDHTTVTLEQTSSDFTGYLVSKPKVQHPGNANNSNWALLYELASNHVLTTDNPQPTPAEVMESTRLMSTVGSKVTPEEGDPYYPLYCGTEVVNGISVTTMVSGEPVTDYDFGIVMIYANVYDSSKGVCVPGFPYIKNHIAKMAMLTNFKFHPSISAWLDVPSQVTPGGEPELVMFGRIFEVDNYAILNREDILKMHESALLNLFDVNSIAKV